MRGTAYIVEDDPVRAERISKIVRAEGLSPLFTRTADEFLLSRSPLRPGYVIMSMFLPGTNGIDAVKRLRDEGCTWPLILISGLDDPNLGRIGTSAGANAVISGVCLGTLPDVLRSYRVGRDRGLALD